VQKHTIGDSLTSQSHKEECDINSILKRWERTGVLEHAQRFEGHYGDFTSIPDFHQAQNAIIQAREMFMTLPAKTRKRFGNDPGEFLDFVSDPENKAAMQDMGLLEPEAVIEAPLAPAAPKVQKEGNPPSEAP